MSEGSWHTFLLWGGNWRAAPRGPKSTCCAFVEARLLSVATSCVVVMFCKCPAARNVESKNNMMKIRFSRYPLAVWWGNRSLQSASTRWLVTLWEPFRKKRRRPRCGPRPVPKSTINFQDLIDSPARRARNWAQHLKSMRSCRVVCVLFLDFTQEENIGNQVCHNNFL